MWYTKIPNHNFARHAFFPGVVQLPSGELLALFALGEAINATNVTTVAMRSKDTGRTWQLEGPIHQKPPGHEHDSDYMKPTCLDDRTLIATGYRFHRTEPDQRLANAETDGIRDGENLVSFSKDEGHTWTEPRVIPRSWPEVIEAAGPSFQLHDGTLLVAGSLMPVWDGSHPSNNVAVLMRSNDRGQTWDDRTVLYCHPQGKYTASEARLCEMQPGRVVCLFWTTDHVSGKNLPNHIVVSHDGGTTWGLRLIPASAPRHRTSFTWVATLCCRSIAIAKEIPVSLFASWISQVTVGRRLTSWTSGPTLPLAKLPDIGIWP